MENDVFEHNYLDMFSILVAGTVKDLNSKVSSTIVFSNMYSGILGTANGDSVLRTANHPPSVIASSDTLACATEDNFNWKTVWPNVTMPGYESIGSAMLTVSRSRAAVFAPFLLEKGRKWEEYATDTALPPVRGVVSNGIRYPSTSSSATATKAAEDRHTAEDHDHPRQMDVSSWQTAPIRVPAWQIAPVELVEGGIMWDYYSYGPYQLPIDRILKWKWDEDVVVMHAHSHDTPHLFGNHYTIPGTQKLPGFATELMPCNEMLLSLELNPVPLDDPFVYASHGDHEHNHGTSNPSSDNSGGDFCTAIFNPVFATSPNEGSTTVTSNIIAGVVVEMFSWTDIFQNTIRGIGHDEELHEVNVVLESKLKLPDGTYSTKSASYCITDYGATLIPPGQMTENDDFADMIHSYEYPTFDENITYSIDVYPVNYAGHTAGVTKQPMFLAIIAACCFLLSVLVFFVYDYFVK